MSPLPSHLLLPKKYVIFPPFTDVAGREFVFAAAFAGFRAVAVAMIVVALLKIRPEC
jgi:hypothetical protein